MEREILLAHAGFLRALARSLARDDSTADEIEQRTWLSALEHPPLHQAAIRTWLATIAVNVSRRMGLSERRRRRRESVVAKPEAIASTADLLERKALMQSVLEGVFTLEEPYRTVLVLRFYDDLPPRKIAAQLGVPVETVRTRIKRALSLLRARLDREHGGDRRWMGLLVPVADVLGGRFSSSASAMSAVTVAWIVGVTVKAIVVGTVGFAILATLWFCLDDSSSAVDLSPPEVPVSVKGQASPEPVLERTFNATPGTSGLFIPAEANATVRVTSPPDDEARFGTLGVQVLWDDDGSPAAGLAVRVVLFERPNLHTLLAEQVSGDQGRLDFRGLSPGTVIVSMDSRMSVSGEVRAGERSEMTIRIPGGARVHGIVTDDRSQPVANASVLIMNRHEPYPSHEIARTDEQGRFTVRGVSAVQAIGARKAGFSPSRVLALEEHLGGDPEGVSLMLVLPGPGGGLRGRVVDHSGAPVKGAEILVGGDGLWDEKMLPDGTHVYNAPTYGQTGSDGTFSLDSLAPHSAAFVRARAKGLAPWSGHVAIDPGRTRDMEIQLLESPMLQGRITDETGAALERATVCWLGRHEDVFVQTCTSAVADGFFRLDGIEVGPVRAFVAGSIEPQLQFETEPGKVYEWNPVLDLGYAYTLRGRLVDERGEPLAGWFCHFRGSFVATDAEGRFAIKLKDDKPCVLSIQPGRGDFPVLAIEGLRPSPEDHLVEVADRLLPSAFVSGRLLDSEGSPVSGGSVSIKFLFQGSAPKSELPYVAFKSKQDHPTGNDGRFSIGPFAPGPYRLAARSHGQGEVDLGDHSLDAGGRVDLGDVRLPTSGSLRVTFTFPVGWKPGFFVANLRSQRGEEQPLEREGDLAYSGPLAPGSYVLWARGYGIATERHRVDIEDGETRQLSLALRAGVWARIQVAFPESAEIARMEEYDARQSATLALYERYDPTVSVVEASGQTLELLMGLAEGGMVEYRVGLVSGHYSVEVTTPAGGRATGEIVVEDVSQPLAPLVLTLER